MEPTTQENRTQGSLSFYCILALAFFVPLVVLPGIPAPFQFSKTFLAIILVALLVITLALQVLRSGKLSFNWSFVLGSALFLPLTYLVSALFSTQPPLSLWGYQLESNTFAFILFGATLVFSISASALSQFRIFSVIIALLASAWVIFIFQFMQVLFGAPFPSLFSDDVTVNLIGSWNDFGIFSGLVLTLSLVSFEMLKLSKKLFVMILATSMVAGFFALLVNAREVWILIAITAFATLMHALTKRIFAHSVHTQGAHRGMKGILSGIIFAIALFSIFFPSAPLMLQEKLNVANVEIRPSLEGTVKVLSGVYASGPFFGSGPNTFSSQWLLHRPEGVVNSPYWNISFFAGNSAILTALVTGGLMVALGWILFFGALFITSVRTLLFSTDSEESTYFLIATTSLGTLYLAVAHMLYPPSQLLTILLFVFAGLFVASLAGTRVVRHIEISFVQAPRLGFVAVFMSVLLIALSVGTVYSAGVTYASSVYNSRSAAALGVGDFDTAFNETTKALALREQDRYYRTLASIDLNRLNNLIVSETEDADTAQTQFRTLLTRALENSNKAIALNDTSFQNWFLRAVIYSAVVPLEINGAYDAAVSALEQSRVFNPQSPEVELRLAQAHLVGGTDAQVSEAVARALTLKPNYTDAILFRAQVEINKGEIDNAITSVSDAIFFEPQNSALLYQLGLLLLEKKAYADASEAFESALTIAPNFANATFFLAHAYSFLDKIPEAVSLLQSLQENNPDSEILTSYLKAFEEGTNPFEVGTVSPEEDSELE